MFDFTQFNTLDELHEELDIIGQAYTRKFVDAELEKLFPGRELGTAARAFMMTFNPRVLTVYPAYTTATEIQDMNDRAVSTTSSWQLGVDISGEDFYDLRSAAGAYINDVVNPALREPVQKWRIEHPEEIVIEEEDYLGE